LKANGAARRINDFGQESNPNSNRHITVKGVLDKTTEDAALTDFRITDKNNFDRAHDA
jgi:hypothetical protein